MMNNSKVRVFNMETVTRLSLQNSVVRKLRSMGCKVVSASLDAMLTIAVEPPKNPVLRHQPGGFSERRMNDGSVVTIDMDGCRVTWVEGKPC
jgi:hypothetical protein